LDFFPLKVCRFALYIAALSIYNILYGALAVLYDSLTLSQFTQSLIAKELYQADFRGFGGGSPPGGEISQ
jgi:hypothetical protein